MLLVTHPTQTIPLNKFTNIIKYIPGINGALKRFGNQKRVMNVAVDRIEKLLTLGKHAIVRKGIMFGGSAFGIKTNVLYWVIK